MNVWKLGRNDLQLFARETVSGTHQRVLSNSGQANDTRGVIARTLEQMPCVWPMYGRWNVEEMLVT